MGGALRLQDKQQSNRAEMLLYKYIHTDILIGDFYFKALFDSSFKSKTFLLST